MLKINTPTVIGVIVIAVIGVIAAVCMFMRFSA